ncbi:PREDICTED: cytoplasmic protein NCK2-like, partial [Priapulus caudatus]|uniref:Cytoplasmic protein NCK2-like n=1 Tax=Priapulus caudatus TaxID=37621 RepID=A0ABM1F1P5_PRICU
MDLFVQNLHEISLYTTIYTNPPPPLPLQVQNSKGQNGFVPSNYVKREKPQKPSLLDNLKKKVKHRKSSDSKTPPSPGYVDVDVDSRDSQDDLLYDHAVVTSDPGAAASPLNLPAVAKFRYEPAREDEVALVKGARLLVLEKSNDGWWRGECAGKAGWFPSNYVQLDAEAATPGDDVAATAAAGEGGATVLALFGFTARNEEELSIARGETLHLVEKPPDDPEWWKLRAAGGALGLVPKNYVKLCEGATAAAAAGAPPDARTSSSPSGSKTPPSPGARGPPSPGARGASARPAEGAAGDSRAQVMADKEFYYGKLSRTDCDNLLGTFGTPGDFLVRDSETHVSTQRDT